MAGRKKIAPLNQNNKVFLLFLLLSALFWFFSTLSENYSYLTQFNLHYRDIPEDLVFQQAPVPQISAQIEASGFTILSHKLSAKNLNLSFTQFKSGKNGNYYFLPNHRIPNLQKQLSDTKIIRFIPDSITIFLGKLTTKKVPVLADLKLRFKPGYKLTKSLLIKPDSLLITGPQTAIDTIQSVPTIQLKIEDIDTDFEKEILLNKLPEKIKINSKKVTIKAKVGKFTQGSIEVPIQINHVPKGVQIVLFPKTVQVNFEVTLEDYAKVTNKSFTISCDYPLKDTNNTLLNLKITKKPDYVSKANLQVQSVNYLIKK